MLNLSFSKAEPSIAEQLTDLVNSAYRGETSKTGWTTEANLLEGLRTDVDDISNLMNNRDSFVLICKQYNELIGSIHITKQADQALLGMLAVKPSLQNLGIGKRILEAAELSAQEAWSTQIFTMNVITSRHELIAFYRRRGYRQTGTITEFPINPRLWSAKVSNLQLELLIKNIQPDT